MQFDRRIRVVSIDSLVDMCRKASQPRVYSFEIGEISSRFVSVRCWWKGDTSNAIEVMFPLVPINDDKAVMLHIHRITRDPKKIPGVTPEIAFYPLTL